MFIQKLFHVESVFYFFLSKRQRKALSEHRHAEMKSFQPDYAYLFMEGHLARSDGFQLGISLLQLLYTAVNQTSYDTNEM